MFTFTNRRTRLARELVTLRTHARELDMAVNYHRGMMRHDTPANRSTHATLASVYSADLAETETKIYNVSVKLGLY